MTKTAEPSAAAVAVFKKSETAVATHAPRGLERGGQEDMILPNILLMQPMSKLVTRTENAHKVGTFVNSLTEEALGTSFEFVPIVYNKYWNLLKLEGKQMVFDCRVTDVNDSRLAGKRFFPKGEQKAEVETVMSYLGMVAGAPAVVKFSKSSTKGGQKLYTLAQLSRKDLFATKYKVFSVKQTGENTYWTRDVEPVGWTSEDEFAAAATMYSAFAPKVDNIVDAGDDA